MSEACQVEIDYSVADGHGKSVGNGEKGRRIEQMGIEVIDDGAGAKVISKELTGTLTV